MTKRREFSTSVKVEIRNRATRDGVVYCEKCGLPAKRWHVDHINPDGLETDKSRKLTAADGQLLCAGSRITCHGRKTAEEDIPAIAKAKRREAAFLGVKTRKGPQIKSPGFAKREREPKRLDAAKIANGSSAIARMFGLDSA